MEESGFFSRSDFRTRSYECDSQGIVNNAIYMNYLEHARHQFLEEIGTNFEEYTRAGIYLVVVRAEVDFKKPLVAGDDFFTITRARSYSRLKVLFSQEIYKQPEEKLMLRASVFVTGYDSKGKFIIPEGVSSFLQSQEKTAFKIQSPSSAS